jgi:hypothetical protein
MAGPFDHAMAGLREVGSHLPGEPGEFLIMFAGDEVDRATKLPEAWPERGEGACADVVEAERQAFRVVAKTTFQDRT